MRRLLLLTFAVSSLSILASCQKADTTVLPRWYAALEKADHDVLGEILADDATIHLEDIDITQSKVEFLDSMSEWKAAIEGGAIKIRKAPDEGAYLAYDVCYNFRDSTMLTHETFRLDGDRIKESRQSDRGDICEGF